MSEAKLKWVADTSYTIRACTCHMPEKMNCYTSLLYDVENIFEGQHKHRAFLVYTISIIVSVLRKVIN